MVVDSTIGHLVQCFFHHLQCFFDTCPSTVPQKKGEGHAAREFGSPPKSSMGWVKLTHRGLKGIDQNLILQFSLGRNHFSNLAEGVLHLSLHLLHLFSMGGVIL